ncbi:MAG: ATP-binding cassette domain-containing protein [Lacibacter sp.]
MQHYLVFLSNAFNKHFFIQQLLDKNATGVFEQFNKTDAALFSSYSMQQFLLEEDIHGYSGIEDAAKQSLRSMSSGEQKKALLKHLLTQKPGLLILDNVFDNLDVEAQQSLRIELEKISKHTPIIQLLHRQRDALDFIKNRITLTEKGEAVPFISAEESEETTTEQTIPPPLHTYQLATDELVRFNNVHVSYDGRQILQNINWAIHAGEFWQLKGPNGSGKTTLLTMITGDNVKGYGQELFIFGRKKGSGETVWEIKNKVGYLTPAMTDLFSTRHTLQQMIISGYVDSIGLYTIPSDMQKRAAHEWLQLLSMEGKANKLFSDLSSGEQRMALIARAMVKHPPLLILDEPLAGLDDHNANKVIQLINKIAAESESAILYVSHQTEKELTPQKVFELTKTENGSVGTML